MTAAGRAGPLGPGVAAALAGALFLAALNTLGDFVWARFVPAHRPVFGLVHGATLCLAIGLVLGAFRWRAAVGAAGGVVVGLLAAGGFYALAPWLGYAAMFPCWMLLWVGFAFLDARVLHGPARAAEPVVRGLAAALGSGLAFYAVSGIWTRPEPGGPSYPYHFACWTVAFLPGFLGLLAGASRPLPLSERSSMKTLILVPALLLGLPAGAPAQAWTPPAPEARCPSKWGAADERGAANHVTAATVLRAARLIRTGEVFELGRVLAPDMSLVGTRRFDVHTKRTGPPAGANRRNSNEELVVAELGQVGTQLDMFSHQGIDGILYNCVPIDQAATRSGFQKLGVEKVGALFTRGVLVDVAGYKGADVLPAGYEIGAEELRGALRKQGLSLQPGDAVLVHTGWGRLWGADDERYGGRAPGVGVAAATWLAEQDVLLIGADTTSVEVSPNPDAALSLPVHQIALVVNGIFLLENLKLDELAAKQAYEFALVAQPLKIRGGTGSTVAPIAVR